MDDPIIDYRDLWNEETNPDWRKPTSNGRFEFTTVNPHRQLQRASLLWGPYGDRWGIRNCKWTVVDVEPAASMLLEAEFFYPSWLDKNTVSFPYAVDMKYAPGFDTCKRMMTALRSKCLSLLGFNSDVYFGRCDDEEYIKHVDAKYRGTEKNKTDALLAIRMAEDPAKLDDWQPRILNAVTSDLLTAEDAKELQKELEKRRAFLLSLEPEQKRES